jgi:hypothetical protein
VTLAQGVLLAVGAIALLALVPRSTAPRRKPRRRARPPRGPRWRRGGRVSRSASDLAAVDRLLNLSVSSAEDEHVRLRPLVAGLARQRLADHTGVRLDGDPDIAAAAVGPDVWELVRPDRPPPADRRSRGIAPARLRRVVESLERIGAPE